MKRKNQEAEQRATDKHRNRTQSEQMQLTCAYNDVHKELQPKGIPAQVYIENKMGQLEDGELKPEKMTHVVAKAEKKGRQLRRRLHSDGAIKIIRGNKVSEVALPQHSEELRYRIKLMDTTWEILRLQLPMNPAIPSLAPEDWQDHMEFVLGEDVIGAEAKSECGTKVYRPSWINVLELEFEFRKHACHVVNKGLGVTPALQQARKDRKVLQHKTHIISHLWPFRPV